MKTKEITELVRAAQNGDTQAQQELYIDSSKSVYYLALKIVRDENDAEDIMQDVFITVFDKLDMLQQPAAYYKWINQITAHKCANFRGQRRALPGEEQDILDVLELEEDENSPTPERLYDDDETRQLILEMIDELPDAQRVCILYRYFNQLSIEEIADITGTNEFTVKSRLALARKKLRAAILAKEEKEGIRLHVIIPIMPILMRALDEFQMPEGLTERMWARIAEGAGIAGGGAAATAASTGAGSAAQAGDAPGGDFAEAGPPQAEPAQQGPPAEAGPDTPQAQADAPQAPSSEAGPDAAQPQGGTEPGAQQADASQADTPQAEPSGADGQAPDAPDTSSPGEAPQATQPKGNDNMNSPNNNTQPQQLGQNPQGQNTNQQQPGQFSQQGQPAQPQQGFPQGQQPGQYAQPQGYPQQAAPQAQPQPYNAMPQGAPGTPPAMGATPAAQAAGATAAKAGMTLGAKIGIAAASVVAVAGLAVAGVLLLPGLLGSPADASAPPAQSVADGAGAGGDSATVPTMPDGFAEEHEIPIEVDGELQTATYEGEYKDGQFSGYGVWTYRNFRYEGYFVNGKPNGEGTLYEANGGDSGLVIITTGNWVDGYADGEIQVIYYTDSDTFVGTNIRVWAFSVTMGYTGGDMEVDNIHGTTPRLKVSAGAIHGIPPFASGVRTKADVPAPDDVEQYALPNED